MSCKQVIPFWGSQNCILFVFVLKWWYWDELQWKLLLTNRKHSRPFFKIFLTLKCQRSDQSWHSWKKKKKYISELLSAIYFMLFNIKKIFHSYLINDKVQSKLVSILLSLLLQSLFFVVLLLSRMNLFYKENCQVQFITWGGNGHLHIVTLLTLKLSMIL